MKQDNGKPWNRGQESSKYLRRFPSFWPHLTEYIEATVCVWDDGYEARCATSFSTEMRDQWNVRKVFPTRDEAAAFAAAFVLKSEELVAAMLAGEAPKLPNEAMREELARELPNVPAVRASREKLAATTTDRERQAAREEMRRVESDAELAWWRSHDWRDFVAPSPKTLAAEPEQEDHDHRIDPAA